MNKIYFHFLNLRPATEKNGKRRNIRTVNLHVTQIKVLRARFCVRINSISLQIFTFLQVLHFWEYFKFNIPIVQEYML